MAYPESRWPIEPGENRYRPASESIRMPEVYDINWCAMFNEAYGHSGLRTMLDVDLCLVLPPAEAHAHQLELAYDELDLLRITGLETPKLEGRVEGVRLLARSGDGGPRLQLTPYVALADADVISYPQPITERPEELIFVPLTGRESLVLYPDYR